ncbi:hypothetical protein [Variovorax sp. PAMC 28711]|uniref:hypothetical protein n=1 Tax=Variovorax sp. PAMC 28711 TaxID=1795631 RepID=UPI00078E7ACC|nr:hypothetical protein [Variovorax sp. PAMC 28711]AMM23175.1 hypothetical protein AX767_01390 [Variovorax sp. PAMC 28711]
MAQRGRKSAASMEVAGVAAPISFVKRLAPAVHISDAERTVWLEMVNDQPAEAFTATHAPLLELYCRHVVQARVIADELANFDRAWMADDEGLKRYDRLLGMAERESRAASSLATRLRITRQAIDQQTVARTLKGGASKERKPWELPA